MCFEDVLSTTCKLYVANMLITCLLVQYEEPEYGAPRDEDEDLGPSSVVDVDNSNFDDVVTNSANDVMVEFYAPWCGHCKSLKPEYQRLAAEFEQVSEIVLKTSFPTLQNNTLSENMLLITYSTLFLQ